MSLAFKPHWHIKDWKYVRLFYHTKSSLGIKGRSTVNCYWVSCLGLGVLWIGKNPCKKYSRDPTLQLRKVHSSLRFRLLPWKNPAKIQTAEALLVVLHYTQVWTLDLHTGFTTQIGPYGLYFKIFWNDFTMLLCSPYGTDISRKHFSTLKTIYESQFQLQTNWSEIQPLVWNQTSTRWKCPILI